MEENLMKTLNTNSKKVATGIKVIAKKMATVSCGAASLLGGYQPKEPKMYK